MLVLVLDSSTPAVTAALAEVTDVDVRLAASRCTVDARAHGELLSPQIAAVLAEAGAGPAGLTAVVAGLGPGPFTGLRVGLATAASIAHALDIAAYGVVSLDALGREAGTDTGLGGGPVLVATDARRRELYWAVYADGQRVTEPAVDTPAVVGRVLPGLGVTAAVGDGALRYADALGVAVRPQPRYPSALRLVELAADRVRTSAPGENLTPCYLRRPDAVATTARKPVLR
ncbi:tRNA (adenosine(37)-N6)-threonylcarbamoyltransferase complex dimerization subunit type 1 TsaB [Solwaraspora sp. WMMB335]|uniref:tRNA (adenosine(37)-N6)-threonylcarbamoyltransferase complex dimerization subunit type 1 TsaB n=1 Tax=Solwaraspora sp. WMMB335 TaxID=3404118 RepID=UPI003B940A59